MGGTQHGEWRRALPVATEADAQRMAEEIERGGRCALTAPNGRDYYVQDGEAWRKASAEHQYRMQRLNAVREELMEIAGAIS